jgi:hypothetical protein
MENTVAEWRTILYSPRYCFRVINPIRSCRFPAPGRLQRRDYTRSVCISKEVSLSESIWEQILIKCTEEYLPRNVRVGGSESICLCNL